MSSIRSFNVIVMGAPKVGKSSFLLRHFNGSFGPDPVFDSPASMIVTTNKGSIQFVFYEGDLPCDVEVDAVLAMFSLTDRDSFDKLLPILSEIKNMGGKLVVCGNKTDIKHRDVEPMEIREKIIDQGYVFHDISAKSNYHYERPFLSLVKMCLDDDSVKLTPRMQ